MVNETKFIKQWIQINRTNILITDAHQYLDGSPLPVSKSHIDLGVIIDVNHKFHEHVSSVEHRASGLCHSFLNSTVCCTPSFMMFLLKTCIRPLIEYTLFVLNTRYRGSAEVRASSKDVDKTYR